MPRVIQPRRHDKELTVEDFWKIRDQGKTNNNALAPHHAFREEEVLLRHRF